MKLLLIILFPFFLSSQTKFEKFLAKPLGPDNPYTVSDCFHYYGSALMTVGFSYIAYKRIPVYEYKRTGKSISIGAGAALFIGVVGKEFIHDKWMGKGVFSTQDIIEDCLGVAGGAIGFKAGVEIHELRKDKRARQIKKLSKDRYN